MGYSAYLTPAGLLALTVIFILRGSLVPKSTVTQIRSDKDAQIAIWKSAYEKSQQAHEIKDQQIASLTEAIQTTNHLVSAMSEATGLDERSRRVRPLASPEE